MMKPSSVKKVQAGQSNIPKPITKPLNSTISKIQQQKKPSVKLIQEKPSMMNSTGGKFTSSSSGIGGKNQLSSSQKKIEQNSMEKKANGVLGKVESKVQKSSVTAASTSTKQQKPTISSTSKPLSTNKLPTSTLSTTKQKPFNLTGTKPTFKPSSKLPPSTQSWSYLPFDLFLMICHFYSHTAHDIYFLSTVCNVWRSHLMSEDGKYCWVKVKQCEKAQSFKGVKMVLQENLAKVREKMAVEYEKGFIKLFNYGSTKENIPNKLIDRLNLQVSVEINKKKFMTKIPFKLKTYNFSSYLCFKLTDIQEFKYDFYTPHNMFKDKLNIKVKFFSRRYKVSHEMGYEMLPEDIVECAIRQKAFNYYLEKNLILTFFEGDNHFLYFFFEISALELVNIFRTSIAESQKATIQNALKKMPMHKKLAETQFQSFSQYMKFQADFQLHMSYHNSIKQIFTFCDTKVYPLQYDNKQAYFMINIDDTFSKVDTYKLDNKMGISEGVHNLFLLDLTLKDRDKFLITFSGFIYARKAELKEREKVENYFNFAENQMKVLEFKGKQYQFRVIVIEEEKKNYIKNIELVFFA